MGLQVCVLCAGFTQLDVGPLLWVSCGPYRTVRQSPLLLECLPSVCAC